MLNVSIADYVAGNEILISKAVFKLNKGEKVGFIGRNGAGKSTMLKIVAGNIVNFRGSVDKPKDWKTAYFSQDLLSFQSDNSLFEVVSTSFGDVIGLFKRLDEEGDTLTPEEIIDIYDRIEQNDGYRVESEIKKVLAGLGFSEQDMLKNFNLLTGQNCPIHSSNELFSFSGKHGTANDFNPSSIWILT